MSKMQISTEKSALDVALVHRYLSEDSYWARGIPLATVQKSLEHSLCFGGYVGDAQVAFARVVTDYATFANLVDVFVLPEYRGRGYSKDLMQAVFTHPQLQGLRRFTLTTADAHALYAQYGFKPMAKPQYMMERYFPDLYQGGQPAGTPEA